ncbi:protein sidekick-2-like [Mytilus edulis]|uniref:protein sidekick-2-like n=1 Tax=Mytilus edulis TaxID=6550 RepID=UPI0039EE43B6
MTCKGGTCQCALNQYWTGYTCSAEKIVNETCTANKECASTLNCSSGRCLCSTNQYWTGSACAAQKSVSVNCNADTECLRPMTCTGDTCECAINHRWTGSTCIALSSVPTSVTLSATSRNIQISWSKPVESKSTIKGYRLRVLLNNECVVEVLLVCSTGCTNVLIQHMCPSDKRQIRENRRNSELMEPMSYEINQLIPYTAYNVWLNAINDAGNGYRSESLVTTDSEVPQKPVAVAASVASSSEIHLTWNLPGPKPGITTYYIKVYEVVLNVQPTFVKGKNVTGLDKQIVQFSGLEAYWNYTFTVVAMTDKGSSEQSDMSDVVTTYQDAPGRVTSFEIKRPSVILTTMEVSWSVPLLRERNGIIKEYKIDHNISRTTTTETIAAESEIFQKLYYITPDRYYKFEIYAVNSLNQAGVKLLKIYYASSHIESSPQVSPKGYTIATVVGAAGGCVILGGLIVGGLVFCLIRRRRRHNNSKQSKANNTQEESKIGGQYEEVGINNVSAKIELGTIDDKNVYDQIDRIPTTDKQYENMMCK